MGQVGADALSFIAVYRSRSRRTGNGRQNQHYRSSIADVTDTGDGARHVPCQDRVGKLGRDRAGEGCNTMADAQGETQATKGATNNALLAAVASAIIAGVISFLVAHWQSQDAVRQAVAVQQVQEVIQLETAVETFDQAAYGAYANGWQCAHRVASACKQVDVNALGGPIVGSPLGSAQDALNVDMNNISDSGIRTDVGNLLGQVQEALGEDGRAEGTTAWADASRTYAHLLIRCGQLIKGE